MYIKHLEWENFTVLHELNMDFSRFMKENHEVLNQTSIAL